MHLGHIDTSDFERHTTNILLRNGPAREWRDLRMSIYVSKKQEPT